MKICYLPSDMDAPGFYRCLSPGRQLRAHGVNVFMPPYETLERVEERPYQDLNGDPILNDDGEPYTYPYETLANTFTVNLALPPSADLYVLHQRKERMWAEGGVNRLRQGGSAVAADVDDDYVSIPEYNPAFYGTHKYRHQDGHIINRRERRKVGRKGYKPTPNTLNWEHMLASFMQVDLLTVSTPHLANVYEPYNKNIEVIRNYVDWDIWDDITPQYELERERLRIGYLGVFRYRKDDLELLQRVLPRFLKDHPEVDFVANEDETHRFLGVPKEQRVTIGLYTFQAKEGDLPLGRMTAVCDIGLVPLADNEMNKGKSHLKGMEYNAAGIPFIATPTESYTFWRDQGLGGNGFLAYNEDDWYEAMELLVENEQVRIDSGKIGRMTAENSSIQKHWRKWFYTYEGLLGDDHYWRARRALALGSVQKTSELGPLLQLVAERRPKVIVEIGTARGGTFWALAQTAPEDAFLVSIDVPAGSPIDIRNGKDVYTGRNREMIKHFVKPSQGLKLINLNSQTPLAFNQLLKALNGREIDLLFIDGDHRYDGVKHDFETYSKLVAPKGMIVFHDIVHHNDPLVGVEYFWKMIKTDKRFVVREIIGPESWGYQPWGGIGVLIRV